MGKQVFRPDWQPPQKFNGSHSVSETDEKQYTELWLQPLILIPTHLYSEIHRPRREIMFEVCDCSCLELLLLCPVYLCMLT